MKLTVFCLCLFLGVASAEWAIAGKKGGGGGGGKGARAAGGGGGGGGVRGRLGVGGGGAAGRGVGMSRAGHAGGAGHAGIGGQQTHAGFGGQKAHAGLGGQQGGGANMHGNGPNPRNLNAGAGKHGLNSHNRLAGGGLNAKGQQGLGGNHQHNAFQGRNGFHGANNRFSHFNGRHWNAAHWRNSHAVFANYHHVWHDHYWWGSHYDVVVVGGGWGPWYWDGGYWFPAWGYDPAFVSYGCDCPVYAYANLPPDQVVVNVQEALQDQGYYAGNIDGQLGQQTRDALGQYQREHSLEITSAIDEPTVQSLGLTNDQA